MQVFGGGGGDGGGGGGGGGWMVRRMCVIAIIACAIAKIMFTYNFSHHMEGIELEAAQHPICVCCVWWEA